MNITEYLAACKRHLGIQSDYALANALQISHSTLCSYRAGRSHPDNDVALTIAQILNVNPIEVIAQANAERAKTPESRARWLGLKEGFRVLLSQAKYAGIERRKAAHYPV